MGHEPTSLVKHPKGDRAHDAKFNEYDFKRFFNKGLNNTSNIKFNLNNYKKL